MTAGDGYPPHADDPVNPDDQAPPARKVPTVPGPPIPSWPTEWSVSPPGQQPPQFFDTVPLDTDPLGTAPLDAGPLDAAPLDAAPLDAGPLDAGPLDAAPLDAALPETAPPDAYPADEWQPWQRPGTQDHQPDTGPWFAPLPGHFDGPDDGPALAPPGSALVRPEPAMPPLGSALVRPEPAMPPLGSALVRPERAMRWPGPAARPPRSAGRRLRAAGRRWWIVLLAGGVAVVLAVTAVVLATVGRNPASRSGASTPGASVAGRPMPAVMFPGALLRDLTRDLQSHNEAAFLSLVAAGARPSVRIWWENEQAIGFTTGVVLPMAAGDQVSINKEGDGTTTVLAGTHNPLDPVDSTGKPAIPCERYQIGLHFAGPAATGQITSWTPLDHDPWDQGTRLYVRKAAGVVVAGPPGDSKFVNEALPLAEAAARYDIGLLDHGSRHDTHQKGFVVFVSAASAAGWSVPQPQGWPQEYSHSQTVTLPGPGVSGDSTALAANVSGGAIGGARVVVTPFEQDQGTVRGETQDLVREFMLDALAPDNGEKVLQSVPSWALQGIGVMVQDLYAGNPNPAPKAYNFTPLMTALRKLPRNYRAGRLPTSADLFSGSVATEQGWSDVAASAYAYIGTTYGVNRMLAAAVLLYAHRNTPFANVVAASTNGSSRYYASGTIEARWRAALARV